MKKEVILPSNVTLDFDDKCKDCDLAQISVTEDELYVNGVGSVTNHTIYCENSDICERICEKLAKMVGK